MAALALYLRKLGLENGLLLGLALLVCIPDFGCDIEEGPYQLLVGPDGFQQRIKLAFNALHANRLAALLAAFGLAEIVAVSGVAAL